MDLPGAKSERLGAPPVVQQEVYIAFFRPASHRVDQSRFPATRWASYQKLAKFHARREGNALDVLELLLRDRLQFQAFIHGATIAENSRTRHSATGSVRANTIMVSVSDAARNSKSHDYCRNAKSTKVIS